MNCYEQLGLKRVINASGKMTALGGSTTHNEVADTLKMASMNFVDISQLINKAGEQISKVTGGEDTCVTSSASAGIAISVASCITRDSITKIEQLPLSFDMPNEVVIQKGHVINFGASITQMIKLGGGVPKEVGQANNVDPKHIEEAISDQTVALLYVKSHHAVQKGMVSLEDMIKISKEKNIPIIVDAAAEEDLKKYVAMGAHLVIYSGAKAVEGPTSGFITGKKELVEYCKLQYKGIGRGMKIGKENILGLVKAVKMYETKDSNFEQQKKNMQWLSEKVNLIHGLSATVVQDEAGRAIYRAQIKIDESTLGMTTKEIIRKLEGGNPAIYTRNHYSNIGIISIDPRPLLEGDEKVLLDRLKEIVTCKGE